MFRHALKQQLSCEERGRLPWEASPNMQDDPGTPPSTQLLLGDSSWLPLPPGRLPVAMPTLRKEEAHVEPPSSLLQLMEAKWQDPVPHTCRKFAVSWRTSPEQCTPLFCELTLY